MISGQGPRTWEFLCHPSLPFPFPFALGGRFRRSRPPIVFLPFRHHQRALNGPTLKNYHKLTISIFTNHSSGSGKRNTILNPNQLLPTKYAPRNIIRSVPDSPPRLRSIYFTFFVHFCFPLFGDFGSVRHIVDYWVGKRRVEAN